MRLHRPIPLSAALALTVVGCGSDPTLPYLAPDAQGVDTGTDSGSGDDAGVTPGTDAGGTPDADAGGSPDADAGGSADADAGGTPDADAGGTPDADGGGLPRPDELPAVLQEAIASICASTAQCLVENGYIESVESCAMLLESYVNETLAESETPGPECYAALAAEQECFASYFDEDCNYIYSVDCYDYEDVTNDACGLPVEDDTEPDFGP